MLDFVKSTTGFDAIHQGSRIIEPKTITAKCFYIVQMPSEVIADTCRQFYADFKREGLSVGEDITQSEQQERIAIQRIMEMYWGRKFPNSRFSRNLLKCTLDNGQQFVHLTLTEVEEMVRQKRIDPYVEKNAP